MARTAVIALMLLAVSSPGFAQSTLLHGDGSGGWPELLSPERREGARYTHAGLAYLVNALASPNPQPIDDQPWVVLERALLRFERAHRVMPDDPELAYYTAVALTEWRRLGTDGAPEYRVDEAIDAWLRLREIDSAYMGEQVAFRLATLRMRRHEFGAARAEYEAALRFSVPRPVRLMGRFYMSLPSERSLASLYAGGSPDQIRANLAEVAMLLGDLPAAIRHYRAAITGSTFPITRALAQWGVALALDRSGEREPALDAAERAIRQDPTQGHPSHRALHDRYGELSVLHLDSVFFEPRYEIHAYEALGHEALARMQHHSPAEERRRALRSWRLFLAEGGTNSRFAAVARAHIARLSPVVEEENNDAADGDEARRQLRFRMDRY